MDKDYWPYPLRHIPEENPTESKQVVVADISRPWGTRSYRQLFTALAPPELAGKILSHPGGIGHEVTTTGPHPSSYNGSFEYKPRFSIWAGDVTPEGLEPLVVSWEAGARTILLPDQGFLMTYGLVPRAKRSNDGDLIHWDDLERPYHDVVVSKMVSEYHFELKSEARVCIDRDYLEDYATLRNLALVQVFYAMNSDDLVSEDRKALSGKEVQEFKLRGRLIDIRIDPLSQSELMAQIWGVRPLFLPKHSPITGGRWDYESLFWPGINVAVTKERSRKLGLEYVYVDDAVLQYYEEHPDKYSIHPESGSVSYGGQWSVSHCQRVSRNLIQLEIKKLYEGCPPEVVKHWHGYAVSPPVGTSATLMQEPNVASRSKRLVYSFIALGDVLAKIANKITPSEDLTSEDFVGLSRSKLDYHGWWTDSSVLPITRHIKKDIGEDSFLERCKSLNWLIVEGLNESKIRQLLLKLGVNREKIKKLKGLKLLDVLIQYSFICQQTGLDLITDSQEIENRWLEKQSKLKHGQHFKTPIDIVFLLYDLRIANAHRGRNMDELLERLGTDKASVNAGMGEQLDRLYDSIAEGLDKTTELLKQCLKQTN